jgi:hypothetical protein
MKIVSTSAAKFIIGSWIVSVFVTIAGLLSGSTQPGGGGFFFYIGHQPIVLPSVVGNIILILIGCTAYGSINKLREQCRQAMVQN